MGTDKPRYEYVPLEGTNSIRVLELLPHMAHSAPLQIRLVHTRLVPPPDTYDEPAIISYEAVSYVWGDPVFTHSLECEGRLLKITRNVNDLLRRLRKPTRARYLWLDSICIDQTHEEEKEHQIALMGDIYRRALKVNVWFGEEEEGDRIGQVFGFFREMAMACARKHIPSRDQEIQDFLEHSSVDIVNRFLERPWFRRRWILQEVALGCDVTVRCGRFKLPWSCLFRSIIALKDCASKSSRMFSADSLLGLDTMAALRLDADHSHILDLLFGFHNSECSDPRDRIFALYGLAANVPEFPVDLKSPWEEVYLNLAVVCVKEGHLISLLQHLVAFGPLDEEARGVPSWVPRWNGRRVSEHRFGPGALYQFPYPYECFIGDDMPDRIWVEESNALTCPIRVTYHASVPPSYPQLSDRVTTDDECHKLMKAMTDAYMRSEDWEYSDDSGCRYFVRGLTAALLDTILHFDAGGHALHWVKNHPAAVAQGRIPDFTGISVGRNEVSEPHGQCFEFLRKLLRTDFPVDADDGSKDGTRIFERMIRNEQIKGLARVLQGHNFFDASLMRLSGWTRCSVRDGDVVFLPLETRGHLAPKDTGFILRPVDTQPDAMADSFRQFRFIGLCFMGRENWFIRGGTPGFILF